MTFGRPRNLAIHHGGGMQNFTRGLPHKTPFYYGWVIFGLAGGMSLVAPVFAVATLSIFIMPMGDELGWSRTLFSGAVSIGGIVGALISPVLGRIIDRSGTGPILAASCIVVGLCAINLAFIGGVVSFYIFYIIGRMTFSGPLQLAPSTAVSNWFVRRRALVLAFIQFAQGVGLGLIPFFSQLFIGEWGWRTSWAILGVFVLIIGVIPPLLLMIRRPEDVGLLPDGAENPVPTAKGNVSNTLDLANDFTLSEALKTPTMWMVMGFTALIFMVQAGTSLHQAPYYIGKGLTPTAAASIVTTFALGSAIGGLFWSAFLSRVSIRVAMGMAAVSMCLGDILMIRADTLVSGQIAGLVFGVGLGGVSSLLRLLWANYYGRTNLGAIRGVSLPIQVGGQASGPLIGGIIFDVTGSYRSALLIFAFAAAMSSFLIFLARPPDLSKVRK